MTIIAALLLLGFLVFIHELGHFLAGVAMKVPVEVFSVGFGPVLLKKNIRGVQFQVAILPFGGYCKFKGESPSEDGVKNDEDSFLNISPLKRIFIYFLGPFFNYILAVIIFAALFMMPTNLVLYSPQIDVYQNTNYSNNVGEQTLAYKYGLRAGDTITAVNGISVKTDRDIMTALSDLQSIAGSQNIVFNIIRDGQTIDITMPSAEVISALNSSSTNNLGIVFGTSLVLGSILDNSPASEAGLKEGDKILAVDGMDVSYISQFRPYIMANANKKSILTILRDGQQINREIFITENNNGVGSIGVAFEMEAVSEETIDGLPFFNSIGKSFIETKNYLVEYVKGLGLLFSGKLPIRDSLAGPVRIIQVTSEIAKSSIYTFLQFGAIISLILFFMNLLPLPVVDGGMIIVALIEVISRRSINRKILYKIQIVGSFILITLAILITANDITFLFK